MGGLLEVIASIQVWAVDLASSPWVLLIIFLGATLDGFFPPAPSEAVLVSAAALGASGEGPHLYFLIPVAALGAFIGDNVGYFLGTKIPLERVRFLKGERGMRTVTRARHILSRRGAALVLGARFIPFGRVVVNMTAGAVSYPRRRFRLLTVCSAIVWASYSVALGIGADAVLGGNPLLAAVVGVVGGALLGLVLERILSWVQSRFAPGLAISDDEWGEITLAAEPADGAGDGPDEGADDVVGDESDPGSGTDREPDEEESEKDADGEAEKEADGRVA